MLTHNADYALAAGNLDMSSWWSFDKIFLHNINIILFLHSDIVHEYLPNFIIANSRAIVNES